MLAQGKKPSVVTSTEGFSLGNPSEKAEPLDTRQVLWGKAEKVIDAGVAARKAQSIVLTVEAGSIEDGDTVKFKDGAAKGITNGVCRIDRIDAQETAKDWTQPPMPGQAYGEAAKQALMKLIENKQVNITVTKSVDATKKRSVCQIDVQGKDVTAEMVKMGAAFLTEKYWKDPPESIQQVGQREALRVFQKEAKAKGAGMFGLPIKEQTDPYVYRKAQKKLQDRYKQSLE